MRSLIKAFPVSLACTHAHAEMVMPPGPNLRQMRTYRRLIVKLPIGLPNLFATLDPMGRGTHDHMHLVMALIRDGYRPLAAAKLVGVAPSTLYRSRLYREWKNEKK